MQPKKAQEGLLCPVGPIKYRYIIASRHKTASTIQFSAGNFTKHRSSLHKRTLFIRLVTLEPDLHCQLAGVVWMGGEQSEGYLGARLDKAEKDITISTDSTKFHHYHTSGLS